VRAARHNNLHQQSLSSIEHASLFTTSLSRNVAVLQAFLCGLLTVYFGYKPCTAISRAAAIRCAAQFVSWHAASACDTV
jgi:hypothetical protein